MSVSPWSSEASRRWRDLANGWRSLDGAVLSLPAGNVELARLPGGDQRGRTTLGSEHYPTPAGGGDETESFPSPAPSARVEQSPDFGFFYRAGVL